MWIKRHERELKGASHYNEFNFAQRVLSYVDDLSPSMVTYQYPLKDSNGKSRYIDFVVDHHTLARPIAIEVDGAKFAGNDYLVRQNAIIGEGFYLLRFTNSQVATEPRSVIKMIETAMESNRRVSRSTTAGGVRRPSRAVMASALGILIVAGIGVTATQFISSNQGGVPPISGSVCPEDHPIKGNNSTSGELIYHVPGGQFYEATNPSECFDSEEHAGSAGYRKSKR